MESLRERLHLRPRTNLIGAVARIRNALAHATHTFFQSRGFIYVHTPLITTSDCEGAGEMFQVPHLPIPYTLAFAHLCTTPYHVPAATVSAFGACLVLLASFCAVARLDNMCMLKAIAHLRISATTTNKSYVHAALHQQVTCCQIA